MNNRYYEEEKFINVELSSDSDHSIFLLIADELSRTFKVKWNDKLDSLDQSYWDFEYKGISLTLHLEHYLGISIFVEKSTANSVISGQTLNEIGYHFKNWFPNL